MIVGERVVGSLDCTDDRLLHWVVEQVWRYGCGAGVQMLDPRFHVRLSHLVWSEERS